MGGRVLGVDISRQLVKEARRLLDAEGVRNARVEEADAQTFPFEQEDFDLVFSRFGIMFFEDPDAAFGNLRSALRPGGGLSFVYWLSPKENLFMVIPLAAAGKHVALPEPGEPDAPGPFAFADLERVRGILSRSGFGEIVTDRVIEKVGRETLGETTGML
jgi:SAM-dependent methyltransferase